MSLNNLDTTHQEFRDRRQNFVCRDPCGCDSTYEVDNSNKKECAKFKVDGGLIGRTQRCSKCDWLVLQLDDNKAYFIELKGTWGPKEQDSMRRKAKKQIKETIERLYEENDGYRLFGRIVYWNRCPNYFDENETDLAVFLSGKGGNLKTENARMIETY